MNETAEGFQFFVVAYVFVTFLAVVPQFFCNNPSRDRQRTYSVRTADETGRNGTQGDERGVDDSLDRSGKSNEGIEFQSTTRSQAQAAPDIPESAMTERIAAINNHIGNVNMAADSMDDAAAGSPVTKFPQDFEQRIQNQQRQSQETRSAATTSRLRPVAKAVPLNSFNLRSVVADVAFRLVRPHDYDPSPSIRSRRRLRTSPTGASQRSLLEEGQSSVPSEVAGGGPSQLRHRSRALSWSGGRRPASLTTRSMASQAANNTLHLETVEGESDFYRNRYLQRSHRHRQLHRSLSNSQSDRSIMAGLPMDAVSPDDAADANDPGRANPFAIQPRPPERWDVVQDSFSKWSDVCELLEPDYDARQIAWQALVSMVISCADPFLRIVLISIISYFVSTESMIAFVLVILFIQLTFEEVSSVLIDVETNYICDSLEVGDEDTCTLVGSQMQLALLMQLLILLPILLVWVFVMDDVVGWLCSGSAPQVAALAGGYTRIIVVDYLVRACCRAFMVPFCLDMHPKFDRYTEVIGTALTLVAIVLVVRLDHAVFGVSSLSAIGVLQVIASIVKSVVKVACVVFSGKLAPYQDGLFGRFMLLDVEAVKSYFFAAVPLFLGSFFELKEWQLLILFMRKFGPSGVAAWAVMGTIWELFEAFAASLGDAGAMHVGLRLLENQADYAMKTAHKVIFFAIIQSLALGSLILMIGPNVSVLLTNDVTIQNELNSLFPMTVLANFAMTFAQVYWSLVGAQERFMVASASILFCRWLLIVPISAICVFGVSFSLDSVAGSIAVGYATASLGLAWTILKTDWNETALQMTQAEQFQSDEALALRLDPDDAYLDEAESDESPIL